MFFSISNIVPMSLGVVILLFAPRIADRILQVSEKRWFTSPRFRNVLYVWPIRVMGIILISFGVWSLTSGPPQGMMKKDENRIALLENGQILKGEVTKRFFQRLAPEGWRVIYKFNVENPETHQEKIYWGSAQGPKDYYVNLSPGDAITIIYNPLNPKINCEIRCFLNHPSFHSTFRKAGKLNLLDKFKDKFEMENYTFKDWYDQQQTKEIR